MDDDLLYLESAKGPTTLVGSTLLVAVDETGHERFADPNFPVFGLGGCGVMVRSYHALIRHPWAAMKAARFGGATVGLHAADFRGATEEQKEAVAAFFKGRQFARFAAVTTDKATIESPLNPYMAVGHLLIRQIGFFAGLTTCTSIALLFEDSERTRGLTMEFFSDLRVRAEEDGHVYELPVHQFFGSKSLREPILEVADFIAQAAGAAVSGKIRGRDPLRRRDFVAVFGSVPTHLARFTQITSARPTSDAA